eukprot:GHVN01069311.1.p1 GENE.GHVN01069311.1~~GHVN01069311.1.p1  ORF type:complete len:205 (-),score=18.83 GHVN01069311.1:150-764(-)
MDTLCDVRSFRISGEKEVALDTPLKDDEELIGVVHLGSGQNCFTVNVLNEIEEHLLKIQHIRSKAVFRMKNTPTTDTHGEFPPTAIILQGTGKFFSNGLHLPSVVEEGAELLHALHRVIGTVMMSPVPIIASINGHAVRKARCCPIAVQRLLQFAGGAILATVCDHRVMNTQKGFYCVNEHNVPIPFTLGKPWAEFRRLIALLL